ncbi:MAG: AAA family ATPase [Acidobacteriota bacterium]|nr:AAA family ATPase [Acidobacteriota bacterium]
MITSLRLVDFKNFADETLRVGPFTVIVGANASGKSNIRDAFRFLHGIGRGYTLAEILGGKYGPGGQAEWRGMRGAPNEVGRVVRTEAGNGFALQVRLEVGDSGWLYLIEVARGAGDARGFRVIRESLSHGSLSTGGWEDVYTSHPLEGGPLPENDQTRLSLRMAKTGSQRKQGHSVAVRSDQPALTQIREYRWLAKSHKDRAQRVIDSLASMRFLDLIPDGMRQPSFPGQTILGDGGENLPTVLRQICADRKRRRRLIDWVRALTPMDVDDLQFPVDPITGLVQLVVVEKGGRTCSAYSVSDGTLRFLAMLAALFADDPTRFYFFEEIDNGIHPARQWLLLELIEKQTAAGGVQVVTSTHSPGLLTSVNDSTFRHTSVVCRPEAATDAIIRPVAELPDAEKLRTSQGLGRLLMGGWMEDMIAFTEDAGDSDA